MFNNTRRVIVIKDVHSNIIEEAIIVLKSNDLDICNNKDLSRKEIKKKNDYIVNEARMMINDYINQSKLSASSGVIQNLLNKKKHLTNTIINIALVSSIVILIYLITKIM